MEAGVAAKHPAMHRAAPPLTVTTKNDLTQNVNSVKIEKARAIYLFFSVGSWMESIRRTIIGNEAIVDILVIFKFTWF